jgi:hypothetical protein
VVPQIFKSAFVEMFGWSVGVHHGMMVFGTVQVLYALTEILEGFENIDIALLLNWRASTWEAPRHTVHSSMSMPFNPGGSRCFPERTNLSLKATKWSSLSRIKGKHHG